MKNDFKKLSSIVDDKTFKKLSESELKFLTGGAGLSTGSYTSGTGSACDNTCVCRPCKPKNK
jgi:hypothetical protein